MATLINDKEIIDLGSITVPTSWNDVTLAQYQEIERYLEDKDKKFNLVEALHIYCNKSEDEINNLPVDFLNIIIEKMSFINEPPKVDKPTNKIEIDGQIYIVNHQNQMKTGEFVATETILKDDKHNYAAILAVLCRKPDEIYDSKFENEVAEERIKMFEQQPITKILPIVNFFLTCYTVSSLITQLSIQVKEEINHIRRHIETSKKSGVKSALYTKLLTRKLKKLEKSIKST